MVGCARYIDGANLSVDVLKVASDITDVQLAPGIGMTIAVNKNILDEKKREQKEKEKELKIWEHNGGGDLDVGQVMSLIVKLPRDKVEEIIRRSTSMVGHIEKYLPGVACATLDDARDAKAAKQKLAAQRQQEEDERLAARRERIIRGLSPGDEEEKEEVVPSERLAKVLAYQPGTAPRPRYKSGVKPLKSYAPSFDEEREKVAALRAKIAAKKAK